VSGGELVRRRVGLATTGAPEFQNRVNTILALASLPIVAAACVLALEPVGAQSTPTAAARPEERTVERLDIDDAGLPFAISELSRGSVDGLHLGIEEIITEKRADSATRVPRFSLHLERKTVRETLDALCARDPRYVWSVDGYTLNVYPRATTSDASCFLNLQVEHIELKDAADPYAALGALFEQHPEQQIGYAQAGGDPSYSAPWTVTLERLTVRQLINRVAEHMGPRTCWTWHGIKTERMFAFWKGGYFAPRD